MPPKVVINHEISNLINKLQSEQSIDDSIKLLQQMETTRYSDSDSSLGSRASTVLSEVDKVSRDEAYQVVSDDTDVSKIIENHRLVFSDNYFIFQI